jgi:hypothetical protein
VADTSHGAAPVPSRPHSKPHPHRLFRSSFLSFGGILECLTLLYVAWGFLALDGYFAFDRFGAIGVNVQGNFGLAEYVRQGVFMLEYVIAIVVLYGATRLGRWCGAALLALLWLSTTVDLAAHAVYGRPAGIGNISTLNASVAMLGAALQEYGHTIAVASGKTTLFFVPLLVKTMRCRRSRWTFLVPLMLICALSGMYGYILVKRGPPALIGFPKGFSYGLGTLYIGINEVLDRPQYLPARPFGPAHGEIRNVIVIVDESVEYDYFSRLFQGKRSLYANFGRAYSGGNCSAASNYILRRAFWRRSDSGHVGITQTDSLFALAKRQGYATTYIDNQQVLSDPTTRNYIDRAELADIDHVIENDGVLYKRDEQTVQQIADHAATGKNFIFVNKAGAHFPYRDYIEPAVVSGDRVSDYITAIRANSVDFLLALQTRIPDGSIVLYTSDHGQSLAGGASHCNTGDAITEQEYRVPFLAMATDPDLQARLQHASHIQHDRLTHLEFSGSIRNAMGYQLDGMKSLFASTPIASPFCGQYGSPKVFFGVRPECKALWAPSGQKEPPIEPGS